MTMAADIVNELLHQFGLSRIALAISSVTQSALSIRSGTVDEAELALGQSKLGGRPDLPASIEWPVWNDQPLSFLAQINLAELPREEFLSLIPSSGLLYFFYSAEQETWGYDPKHRGSWRVLYNAADPITRLDFPSGLPAYAQYRACSMSFHQTLTIPGWETLYVQPLQLTRTELDQFFALGDEMRRRYGQPGHQLLGHPDEIQNEMQVECQFASHGIYMGDGSGRTDPRAAALEADATNWQLLLQLDTDDDAGMMWGDVGRLYFWIPRGELAQRNFDAVWMVLQCT